MIFPTKFIFDLFWMGNCGCDSETYHINKFELEMEDAQNENYEKNL